MVTQAPNANANQPLSLKDAVQNNDKVSEDLIDAAASWSNSMGGADISLGAKYSLGPLTPGIVYAIKEYDVAGAKFAQESGLVIGASYAAGGGLLGFLEYMKIEKGGRMKASDEDTLLIGGLRLDF